MYNFALESMCNAQKDVGMSGESIKVKRLSALMGLAFFSSSGRRAKQKAAGRSGRRRTLTCPETESEEKI